MGLLGIAGKKIGQNASLKAENMKRLWSWAESTWNVISRHVTKTLTDGKISNEEYSLILVKKTDESRPQRTI